MSDCATTGCGRPAPDATICPSCTGQASGLLRRVPWLVEQLTITLTRRARMGDRNGPRSAESPVPFDHRASVDLDLLRSELTRWAALVAAHRGVTIDADLQPTPLSKWLLRWNGAAAQHPDAGDYLDTLTSIVRSAERTVDRAPDLRYVGPCDDCTADLYAAAGRPSAVVRCPTVDCGAEYPMEERRAWLLEQTYDRLLTANEMSRAIADLIPGHPLTPNRISQWAARGRVTKYLPHARDPHKRVRFRVEDVINQLRAVMDAGRQTA